WSATSTAADPSRRSGLAQSERPRGGEHTQLQAVEPYVSPEYHERHERWRSLRCLPEPPFGNELAERDGGLLLVDADAQDVEVRLLCQARDLVLPAPGARRQRAQRLARQDARTAGLDVERLDPAGRDR